MISREQPPFVVPREAAIRDGLAYVNVYSTRYPGGEIRGQIR